MLNRKQRSVFDSHVWLVRPIALGLSAAWRDLDFDDAYQDGCLGLMGACSKYRAGLREQFLSYARTKIRGAIINGFLQRSPGARQDLVGGRVIEVSFESETETAPAASLDQRDVDLVLFRVDLRRHLRALSDVERFVLWAIYHSEWSQQRIADHLGVCRWEVRVIHRRVLKGLRKRLGAGGSSMVGRRRAGQSGYASRSSLMVR